MFFILLSCSKDSPIPDAVLSTPEPSVTKFTLAVAGSEGWSVDISGGTYNENSNVSVTASPAQGYVFSGWTGNALGSTNPLTVNMTGNKDITATFSRSQYALTDGVVGYGSVNQELVSSAKSKTDYDSGSTVHLTATPETGRVNQASGIISNYPNGAKIGVVNWTPSAAGTYYYQCSVHDGIYGAIIVQ